MTNFEVLSLGAHIEKLTPIRNLGRVSAVEGNLLRIRGLAGIARVGDSVSIERGNAAPLTGEVVQLHENDVSALPNGSLDGVAIGDPARLLGNGEIAPCDGWIGRIVDPDGNALDGEPLMRGGQTVPLKAAPPPATLRKPLGERLETGTTAFNTMLPIVRGQRMGLFAGSGVGKSTLLARLATGIDADLVVIALVGERGREIREFVENVLGKEGLKKSIVVAATSDQPPTSRRKCALTAMSTAEYFRDQGRHVLLLVDSVTRYAEAHREIAVAGGEMPALRGFPASTSHAIMSLCERAGPGARDGGDITAVFSVLVAGADMDEPIADILRGVLDGHVVLDRKIAERGRYPAIDILKSVSRSLPAAASDRQNETLRMVRHLVGAYESSEVMVKAGLYANGSDPELDAALKAWPELEGFWAEEARVDIETCYARLDLILRRAKSGARG